MRTACVVLLTVVVAFVSAKKRYDGYQILETHPQSRDHAEILMNLQEQSLIDIHGAISRKEAPARFTVSPGALPRVKVALQTSGMKFSVVDSNIQKILDVEEQRLANKKAFDLDDFNTFEEIYDQLDVWAESCTGNVQCSNYVIGTSYEGREIRAFRIGNGNPVILIDNLVHAREWLTAATSLKIMDLLIFNNNNDPIVNELLESYDFVFVPVMNPDGYVYSWTDDRYWRKCRAPNEGSPCKGVDLNRNFDVEQWGRQGISSNPCSDLYCGPSPASQVETQALQNEGLRLQDESGIVAWVTIHSYALMWMFPWGYTEDFTSFTPCVRPDDYDDLYFVAEAAQQAILESSGVEWDIGTSCEIIYPTTGGTDDWAKSEAGVKYAFTPELRGRDFVISPDQIQPSFEEVWAATVAMIRAIEEI